MAASVPTGRAVAPNGQVQLTEGGIYAIIPDSETSGDGCRSLFPSATDHPENIEKGETTNQITCHDDSGVCFWTAWVDSFDADSDTTNCLHWSARRDISPRRRHTAPATL